MNLFGFLKEDISNTERQYRQFVNILKIYGVKNINDIEVHITPKHNYRVMVGEKKVCLLSGNIVDIETLKENKIKVVE